MKIVDFFKRIFNKKTNQQTLNGQRTRYSEYVESIDDLELCKMFVERTTRSVTPEIVKIIQQYEGKTYDYPLQTRISKDDSLELARRFFESIGNGFCEKYNKIINGGNPNLIFKMEEFNGKGACVTGPDKMPVTVYVPIRGDIRQLYELVHECTHTFDIDNGDTPTRKVLGEVAPQCMERLLDEFLLKMSDEDMQKYGFDRETIIKDVKDRRIITFLSRFNNAQDLNRGSRDRVLDSRYMLAQIYSAHFNKFDSNVKKNKLLSFIECVNNDDFYGANRCFEIQIDRNSKFERKKYINSTILEVVSLVRTIIPKENTIRIEEKPRHKLAKKGKYVTGRKLGIQAVADIQDIEITDKENAEIARKQRTNSQTKENQDIGE